MKVDSEQREAMIVFLGRRGACNPIINEQFNASLRDYSTQEEQSNTSDVRTLQKVYQYSKVPPTTSNLRLKKVPDSLLSPSQVQSRGLLQHGHHGYALVDYEENPQYGYEYHFQDDHGQFDHHHHLVDHHQGHHLHHDGHKFGIGHHYKHYDHALAAKTVLWPIAGIALLGAAAALVSNPILLQLGVVSGRRRRRDADDKLPDFSKPDYLRTSAKQPTIKPNNFHIHNKQSELKTANNKPIKVQTKEEVKYNRQLSRRVNPTVKISLKTLKTSKYDSESHEKLYIPIQIKTKN